MDRVRRTRRKEENDETQPCSQIAEPKVKLREHGEGGGGKKVERAFLITEGIVFRKLIN